jgi:hypothetical protein
MAQRYRYSQPRLNVEDADRDSKGIQVFSNGGRAQLHKITIRQLRSAWQ